MHQAKHNNNKAGPANKRALLDEPINYLDPLVQVAAPTVATIYRGTESVIHRLEKKYQRLLEIAWDGVGKGVSKKGIFLVLVDLLFPLQGKRATNRALILIQMLVILFVQNAYCLLGSQYQP